MKSALLVFAILIGMGCGGQQPPLVITGVTVIDAVHGARQGQTVVIEGSQITGVHEAYTPPQGATVVDGTGKYLIPGLWDAHVHLDYQPEIVPAMLPLFLANGITRIRDTGGHLENVLPWREKIERGEIPSPALYLAGPLIDGVPRVYDGSTPGRPDLSIGAPTPEAARQIVDSLAAAGVDLIKAYEMLTPEAFRAVVEQAARHGLPVTGHVPLSMLAPDAATAGLRSVEHLRNLEMACASDAEDLLAKRLELLAMGANDPGGALRSSIHTAQRMPAIASQDETRCAEVLKALANAETWQIPTLTILAARHNRLYADPSWRSTFRYLPTAVRERWTALATQMAEAPTSPDATAFAQWGFDMVAKVRDADIGLMAGTDTPIFFLTPGFSLHKELALLVHSGLTPIEALAAATLRPAQYFNLDATLGTIEAGKTADLVLLNANPLDDIRNTQQIEAVVQAGKHYDRMMLDALLNALAQQ